MVLASPGPVLGQDGRVPTPPSSAAVLHRAWAPDLECATLYALLRLRVDVFVVEQACAYAELDGRDLEPSTRHYWLAGEDRADLPIGYLRLLQDGRGDYRIGRLCTARLARGRGLARQLLEGALAEVGTTPCVLDAQEHLAGLYQAFGFVVVGERYDWDGVPHLPMRRG